MKTHLLLVLSAVAIVGCASHTRPASYGLDPHNAALVRQTCTDVMGLHVGLAEFDACGDSLAESVRVMNDAKLTMQASDSCERQGLEPGTAELAKCVVASRGDSLNFSPQHERAELSCAQLGLHPASGGFRQCVANLKLAMFQIQNPL